MSLSAASRYVPLLARTNFSFLEGAAHPEELIEETAEIGLRRIAIIDRDGVYGIVRAHMAAREHGVRILIGSQLTIDDGSTIVLIAENRTGYSNLCQLITVGRLRSAKGQCQIGWEELYERAEGLVALWGGDEARIADPAEPTLIAGSLRDAFGDRLYVMLTRHKRARDVDIEARLRDRARRYQLQTVAANEVLYATPARRDLQDVITCIKHGVTLSSAGRRLKPNGEHALLSPHAFRKRFSDDPGSVERTLEVAERCTFSLDELRYVYPAERLPDGRTTDEWLRELTIHGARGRYDDEVPQRVIDQIDKELDLIHELEYEGYFLTMYEIVRFCEEQGILCQGRGSAANSAVCFCLGVTAVDPARSNLLFERFLSRERAEPPDIDLDIEHDRREEVIQHMYAKYGRERAAMVATVVRYRGRSAVREVGKVFGLAETTLDRLAKLVGHREAAVDESLHEVGLDPDAALTRHFMRLVAEIQDFPRHLSIHPGGFLLGHEPVSDLVPIENGAMEGRTVIQWDKDDIEDLGLFKVDLLGLGALSQLHRAFDLLAEHEGLDLDMARIPAEDPETFRMIQRADTIGVFQIESRAQMAMLPRLLPETHYDLVIEISIVRPGPISGGMVHPYLRRKRGEEPVEYPHPSLEPVLAKTLGVPLFQEQVMQLAIIAADYTPGEADQLRRDMAAWRRTGRLERHRERLVTRMKAKGIEEELALRVFEQIRGFGEYGFPESHAASFALIAYATSWLKCHHPAVFACALLNSLPMGFYSAATIVEDAKRHGIVVRSICVNRSRGPCTLEHVLDRDGQSTAGRPVHPWAIRMGFEFVKGLRGSEIERVVDARTEGVYSTVDDFVRRSGLREDALVRLAEAGALDGFRIPRREAIWKVRGLAREREQQQGQPSIAGAVREGAARFRKLDGFDQIAWDYQTTGHSARGHPLGPLRPELRRRKIPPATDLNRSPNGSKVRYAGLVICRQRPGTASGVLFMTLEDETGFVNVVVWPKVYEQYRLVARTTNFLGVSGRLQSEDGTVHLIASALWRPEFDTETDSRSGVPNEPPNVGSRDFH